VICGRAWFDETFHQLGDDIAIHWNGADGDRIDGETVVCRLQGNARAILSGERTALNFLQTLSATATTTAAYVAAVAGTGARILDTRKTIPGLRAAQKYAVRCGGASNHRFGLFDAILIKENHIEALGSLDAAIDAASAAASAAAGAMLVEVEIETMDQLERALASRATRLMLDNFTPDQMTAAVRMRNEKNPEIELEASGSITLDNIRAIAATGVDYISVGSLTKSVSAIDFSLRVV